MLGDSGSVVAFAHHLFCFLSSFFKEKSPKPSATDTQDSLSFCVKNQNHPSFSRRLQCECKKKTNKFHHPHHQLRFHNFTVLTIFRPTSIQTWNTYSCARRTHLHQISLDSSSCNLPHQTPNRLHQFTKKRNHHIACK